MKTTKIAEACFKENFELFGKDTEKHNLYKGLYQMAAVIGALQSKVMELEQRIKAIKSRV